MYLGYRYALFSLTFLTTFVSALHSAIYQSSELFWGVLVGDILYFILDIGLTVILQSIRAGRGRLVRIENPLNDFE